MDDITNRIRSANKVTLYCPECGSDQAFWHCHERCQANDHAVTCLKCMTIYLHEYRPADGK